MANFEYIFIILCLTGNQLEDFNEGKMDAVELFST